jgi:hypothetical protein
MLVWTGALCLLTGCTDGGRLGIWSEADPNRTVQGDFESGIYRLDDKSRFTALLLQGSADNPSQALVLHMFWQPTAGSTPLDPDATNVSIRYVLFSGPGLDQVAIYQGGGFAYPQQSLGAALLSVKIEQANLQLFDASKGFEDPLGAAGASGRVSLRRDDSAVLAAMRRLNLQITKRLGYPRLVRGE